jgi:hypothetical protein
MRRSPAFPGRGCPCCLSKETPIVAAYDGWPLLGDTAIKPGESRRLGFVFLFGEETAKLFRDAGKFFCGKVDLSAKRLLCRELASQHRGPDPYGTSKWTMTLSPSEP